MSQFHVQEEKVPNGLVLGSLDHEKIPPLPSPDWGFQLHTLILACGERGKGKTYSIASLLNRLFREKYITRVYLLTTTYESNTTLHTFPVRQEDVYEDPHQGQLAVANIEKKVKEEALIHQTILEYNKDYRELMTMKNEGVPYSMIAEDLKTYFILMKKAILWIYLDAYYRFKKQLRNGKPNISYQDHKLISEGIAIYKGETMNIKSFLEKLFETEDELEDTYKGMERAADIIKLITSGSKKAKVEYNDFDGKDETEWPEFFPEVPLEKPVPFFMIDDMSHTDVYNIGSKNPLINVALRHRHIGGPGYGLSIICCMQYYHSFPKSFRNNLQIIQFYYTADTTTIEHVWREVSGMGITWDMFKVLYRQACQPSLNSQEDKDKHHFLYIDKNRDVIGRDYDTRFIFQRESIDDLLNRVHSSKRKTKIESDDSNDDNTEDKNHERYQEFLTEMKSKKVKQFK